MDREKEKSKGLPPEPRPEESSQDSLTFESVEELFDIFYITKEHEVWKLTNLRWSSMPNFIDATTEQGTRVTIYRSDLNFRLRTRKET